MILSDPYNLWFFGDIIMLYVRWENWETNYFVGNTESWRKTQAFCPRWLSQMPWCPFSWTILSSSVGTTTATNIILMGVFTMR